MRKATACLILTMSLGRSVCALGYRIAEITVLRLLMSFLRLFFESSGCNRVRKIPSRLRRVYIAISVICGILYSDTVIRFVDDERIFEMETTSLMRTLVEYVGDSQAFSAFYMADQ
ncbi:uncharacterized protein BDW43DRAFT_189239 [Aspergillus alliaceus]|uniref:uncharacterized protein n=1 Tax=Petromyces alliaceus TaxID=209559 RepID=UPI0012A7290B|nr:uncharacterized protein BDW43DRAFT_189239 [Aspergillus alliaceus]KAB8229372.1 hypothetical protein BDW43DRAFT_189239 [Aspergillus alliaceus]